MIGMGFGAARCGGHAECVCVACGSYALLFTLPEGAAYSATRPTKQGDEWMAERLDDRTSDRLEDLGEFGLIARLTRDLPGRTDVVLPAGDDAALLDLSGAGDMLLVATCDAQVEGRHFIRGVATPEEIGWKALAVNLSDIAAMGAEPLWALVSLLLPAGESVAELDGVYTGMRALARRYGVAIVGGNVAGTPGPLAIDITLLGRVAPARALTRAGGRLGDALMVTGTLGAAAAGERHV